MSQPQQNNPQFLMQQTQIQTLTTALRQLNNDNESLKKQITELKIENQKLVELTKQTQEWKDKYEKLHKQHHSVEHGLKKKDEEISKLQNTINELQEKTKDLNDYHKLKVIAQNLQLQNADQTNELEQFRKKQLFVIKSSTKIENQKHYLSVILQWDREIQNLQLTYKVEGDKLIFDGYGDLKDKKVVYQQYHELTKQVQKGAAEKPNISLKQSQMIITFEV